MMRSGRLLAEDSPENLLREYNLSSLEDVFLKLCMADCGNEDKTANRIPTQQQCTGGIDNVAFHPSSSELDISGTENPQQMELNLLHRKKHELPLSLSLADISQTSFPNFNGTGVNKRSNRIFTKSVLPSANRLSALIRKNGLQMFRNIGYDT
jgi:hypothetical protein